MAAAGLALRLQAARGLRVCVCPPALAVAAAKATRRAAWRSAGRAPLPVVAAQPAAAAGASPESQLGSQMSGEVLLVKDLFTDPKFLFCMPAFQRPYDWHEEDAAQMLDDFLACIAPGPTMGAADAGELEAPYLLGAINLSADGPSGGGGQRKLYVVDGQQRIVTLCLLFGAARSRFLAAGDSQYQELVQQIQHLLLQEGNLLLIRPEEPRVEMQRQDDTLFLRKLLLEPDFQRDGGQKLEGDSQPKLWANMQLYRKAMADMELPALMQLVQFALLRVALTVTTCATIAVALKYFSVSAQRGRQLQPIDVLKGICFSPGMMAQERQDEYGRRWSELERRQVGPDSLLGRDGISRVCQILATLHLRKSKGSGNEFDDLQRLFMVLTKASVGAADNTAGPAFFDSVLEPYAKLYVRLVTDDWAGVQFGDGSGGSDVGRLEQQQQADRVRYLLTCLSRLRPTRADASPPVWEPLVLGVLMQQRLGQLRLQALVELLEDVERLAWFWALCGGSKAIRTKRLLQALQELGLAGAEVDGGVAAGMSDASGTQQEQGQRQGLVPAICGERCPALKLSAAEVELMLAALDGPVYKTLSGRNPTSLLVRLNEHLQQQRLGATYMRPYEASDMNLTVEHILPQKPAAGSGWQVAFPGGQAASWLHRMGNLALLHGNRNSRASNRSFQEKKGHYKGTGVDKQYGTAIPLTDSVLQLDRWDPPAAAARQREHIALAIDCWRLDAQAAAVGGMQQAAAQPPL